MVHFPESVLGKLVEVGPVSEIALDLALQVHGWRQGKSQMRKKWKADQS